MIEWMQRGRKSEVKLSEKVLNILRQLTISVPQLVFVPQTMWNTGFI